MKVKVKSNPQQPHGLQPSRLLRSWDFPGKSTGGGANILNSTSCQEHANQNHNEITLRIKQDSFNKRMSTTVGENVEKLKHPYFVGGDVNGVPTFESSLMTLQKAKQNYPVI